eukprot:5556964-Pleurochrysis_carterae.AAC.2
MPRSWLLVPAQGYVGGRRLARGAYALSADRRGRGGRADAHGGGRGDAEVSPPLLQCTQVCLRMCMRARGCEDAWLRSDQ